MLIHTLNDYETLESHVLLMGGASRYFPVMISTDTYLTIFMFLMILCGSFPFMVFGSASVHKLDEEDPQSTLILTHLVVNVHIHGSCVGKYNISNPTRTEKQSPPMSQCIYERIGPTILHVIHFPTLTMRLLTEYLLKYSNHVLLLFSSKGKTPIYRWQCRLEGQGTKVKVVAFMLFLMILRLD